MNQQILERALEWANNPLIEASSRQEIQQLIDQKNEKELTERFHKDIEFGTGGLRSIYAAGTNRINKVTIQKASHALAVTLKKTYPDTQLRLSVSFDSRHGSQLFAQTASAVFAAHGIQVFLFDRMNPVPLLSYSIRYHQAHAGVMVTASHNPKDYNGFKVYWGDGAQVTPPHDRAIIEQYYAIQGLDEIPSHNYEQALQSGQIQIVGEQVEQAYQDMLYQHAINPELCREKGDQLPIVYTPIHGAGLHSCPEALRRLGFTKVEMPEAQTHPNGDFPTVKSPNPENPEAMQMAVELMKKSGAKIAFGSDPDADRLGVALEHEGQIIFPNGNQIGTLMLYYILEQYQQRGTLPLNAYMVKSIVTTPLLEKMAQSYGVECFNTLTGFKWICGKMTQIEQTQKRPFLFATEESFGYLHHDQVRDKDGVGSVALAAEMALWYQEQGLNLIEALDKIYERFGFSHETLLSLDYLGIEGANKIQRIMETFRTFKGEQIAGMAMRTREDYLELTKWQLDTDQKIPLEHAKSNVLGFEFTNGDILYLRPSGTEPKIKFYIMIHEANGDLKAKKARAAERTQVYLDFIRQIAEEA